MEGHYRVLFPLICTFIIIFLLGSIAVTGAAVTTIPPGFILLPAVVFTAFFLFNVPFMPASNKHMLHKFQGTEKQDYLYVEKFSLDRHEK